MKTKHRLIKDSKTRKNSDHKSLVKSLTSCQYYTMESLLNSEYKGARLYDPKIGGFYNRKMIPCLDNTLSKAINKKVDKFIKVMLKKNVLRRVEDMRGRTVLMVNPDLYWDNITYELYYNRWLFELGSHRQASEAVNLSLQTGYFYHAVKGGIISKISNYHWIKMCKWWLLIDNEYSTNLFTFDSYQPS